MFHFISMAGTLMVCVCATTGPHVFSLPLICTLLAKTVTNGHVYTAPAQVNTINFIIKQRAMATEEE
jgi:hypothetical protein